MSIEETITKELSYPELNRQLTVERLAALIHRQRLEAQRDVLEKLRTGPEHSNPNCLMCGHKDRGVSVALNAIEAELKEAA